MKVWLVGICGYDSTITKHVCLSYNSAVKQWNEVRDELIKGCEEMVEYTEREGYADKKDWEDYILALRGLKPGERTDTVIDNPFIVPGKGFGKTPGFIRGDEP